MHPRFGLVVAAVLFVGFACTCGGSGTDDGGTDGGCTPQCSGKTCGSDTCGGQCPPGCTGGQVCNAAGRCVNPTTDGGGGSDGGIDCGGCAAGETCCGLSGRCCKSNEICDPGFGDCKEPCNPKCPSATHTCDTSNPPNYVCKPKLVTCGSPAVTCKVGQLCENNVCRCMPPRDNGSGGLLDDTCFAYGYVCNVLAGECRIPGETEWCTKVGGCQPGFDCVPATTGSDGVTTKQILRCARGCSSDSDCNFPGAPRCFTQNDPQRPGLTNHCTWGTCDSPDAGLISPYAPCMQGRGTCVFESEPAFEFGANVYFSRVAKCIRSGTAAPGANCSPQARLWDGGDPTQACSNSEYCLPLVDGTGFCGKACIYSYGYPLSGDPAPCAATTTCYNATGIYFQVNPDAGSIPLQGGVCMKDCDLAAGDGGCSPNASGRSFTCGMHPGETAAYLFAGKGACLPTASGAPGPGGACTTPPVSDDRQSKVCADRAVCSDYFFNVDAGTCLPFCEINQCDGGPCPSNCPGPTPTCNYLFTPDAGARMGLCQ